MTQSLTFDDYNMENYFYSLVDTDVVKSALRLNKKVLQTGVFEATACNCGS